MSKKLLTPYGKMFKLLDRYFPGHIDKRESSNELSFIDKSGLNLDSNLVGVLRHRFHGGIYFFPDGGDVPERLETLLYLSWHRNQLIKLSRIRKFLAENDYTTKTPFTVRDKGGEYLPIIDIGLRYEFPVGKSKLVHVVDGREKVALKTDLSDTVSIAMSSVCYRE